MMTGSSAWFLRSYVNSIQIWIGSAYSAYQELQFWMVPCLSASLAKYLKISLAVCDIVLQTGSLGLE